MEKSKKGGLLLAVVLIILAVIHIPKFTTALWIGSDEGLESLIEQDSSDNSIPIVDIIVEIDGKMVFQTEKANFSRFRYTRKDFPLRAGLHKFRIISERMNIDVEKYCFTLFNYYIAIEFFSPDLNEESNRVYLWTGFMPIQFM